MTENNANKDINKYLFINLVTMLSITAMQQLGKLVNPTIGKTKVNHAFSVINFEAAQATIDTLDMLSAKTEGKLDNDEARLLKDTLAALKMNYVETRDEEERKKAQSGKGTEAQSDGEKQSRPEPQAQDKSEASEPKPETEQAQKTEPHKSEVGLSAEASAKAEDQQDIKKANRQEDSKAQGTGNDTTKTKDPKFHKSYD